MAAHHGFPGGVLARAVLLFFVRQPADGSWVKNDLSAGHGGEPSRFRIPLIPADAGADTAKAGVEAPKAQVTRREIKLLVVQRIVGDVHLAVHAELRSVGV